MQDEPKRPCGRPVEKLLFSGLLFMAGVSPDKALSNLAGWLDIVGLGEWGEGFTATANIVVRAAAVIMLALLYGRRPAAFVYHRFRKRLRPKAASGDAAAASFAFGTSKPTGETGPPPKLPWWKRLFRLGQATLTVVRTVRGLRETVRSLTQEPLGAGHTYARLPAGTNIVSMADGTYRLALPVRIAGRGRAHFPSGSAKLTVRKSDPEE